MFLWQQKVQRRNWGGIQWRRQFCWKSFVPETISFNINKMSVIKPLTNTGVLNLRLISSPYKFSEKNIINNSISFPGLLKNICEDRFNLNSCLVVLNQNPTCRGQPSYKVYVFVKLYFTMNRQLDLGHVGLGSHYESTTSSYCSFMWVDQNNPTPLTPEDQLHSLYRVPTHWLLGSR